MSFFMTYILLYIIYHALVSIMSFPCLSDQETILKTEQGCCRDVRRSSSLRIGPIFSDHYRDRSPIQSFLERSNVVSLCVKAPLKKTLYGAMMPLNWLPCLQHMRVLFLDFKEGPFNHLLDSTGGKTVALFPDLHNLVLLDCRLQYRVPSWIRQVVEVSPLSRLVFVDYDMSVETEAEFGTDQVEELALEECLRQRGVRVTDEGDDVTPGPNDNWDMYVQTLISDALT
jgi:hypothetical protein